MNCVVLWTTIATFNADISFMYIILKNMNILGQILLLFTFITIVDILASPEFSPQTFNSLEFQVHNCIQECLNYVPETCINKLRNKCRA